MQYLSQRQWCPPTRLHTIISHTITVGFFIAQGPQIFRILQTCKTHTSQNNVVSSLTSLRENMSAFILNYVQSYIQIYILLPYRCI